MSTEDRKSNESLLALLGEKLSRRFFLRNTALTALGVELALYSKPIGASVKSDILADEHQKDGLHLLNDQPLNAETPPHLLDDEITPTNRLFVRNNGRIPEFATKQDASQWSLTIDGEVEKPLTLNLKQLKNQFKNYSYQLVLECGGNGRVGFSPPTPGLQWGYGAVGCPRWEGVLLKDVLEAAGVKKSAVYIGYYGYDIHASGSSDKSPISRGIPIAKALDPMTLIAFGMNGQPLSAAHGFPARLVCPGYPASASGKWLKRLWVRDCVHDGAKMEGYAYRIPQYPVAPGTKVAEQDMKIIEHMPVKSLITFPRSGRRLSLDRTKRILCRGFAWSGYGPITAVDLSYNFGQTWQRAQLKPPANPYAWQRWEASLSVPSRGYYEVWARATDSCGNSQPMLVPGWNPRGYLNNAMPRTSLVVG